MTIYRKVNVSEHPPKWGWYDTDKGELFWYEVKLAWSCNDDWLSEEYPKFWYQEIDLPSKDEIHDSPSCTSLETVDERMIFADGADYIIDMITKTK